MNIVYIFDKAKTDYLHSLGFIYNEKEIDNKKAYQFFGTDELMKSLNSNFERSDFLVSKICAFRKETYWIISYLDTILK